MLHNMKKNTLKSFCFKCFMSASQKVPLFFGLLSEIQVLHNALTALLDEQRLALNSEHHKSYVRWRTDVHFAVRSSMLEFLKQIRARKTFLYSLSGFYTLSVLFYKRFTIINTWYLFNITQAQSRILPCAVSLTNRRRHSKASYFIYCRTGMNLCAEL